jgi:hypothetical protein
MGTKELANMVLDKDSSLGSPIFNIFSREEKEKILVGIFTIAKECIDDAGRNKENDRDVQLFIENETVRRNVWQNGEETTKTVARKAQAR